MNIRNKKIINITLITVHLLFFSCQTYHPFEIRKVKSTGLYDIANENDIIIGKVEDLDGHGNPKSYTSWYNYLYFFGMPPKISLKIDGKNSEFNTDDNGYFIYQYKSGIIPQGSHKFVVKGGVEWEVTWKIDLSPASSTKVESGTITVLPIIGITRDIYSFSVFTGENKDDFVDQFDSGHKRSKEIVDHFRKIYPEIFETNKKIVFKQVEENSNPYKWESWTIESQFIHGHPKDANNWHLNAYSSRFAAKRIDF